jgi:hypothetical protein
MIIEILTVTTTPTTISDLLETARGGARTKNGRVEGFNFRVDVSETVAVLIEESDTSAAVTLLDPANGQTFAAWTDIDMDQSLLSAASGTVDVGMIASQSGAGK